eukprot:m.130128 g.130128  ORF g.130128 m.130128 type:complete len:426 (-) comp29460_c5_seq2:534-1811(-)
MLYMYMFMIGTVLCVSTASVPSTPSIHTDGSDITIVAKKIEIAIIDPLTGGVSPSSPIVSEADLLDFASEQDVALNAGLFNMQTQIMTNLSLVNVALSESLKIANKQLTRLATENTQLQSNLAQLAKALDSRLPPTNVSCGEYTLTNGKVIGHDLHTSPGAVRTLKCDPGYELSSSDSFIICGGSGDWSDNSTTICRTPVSAAPTTSPTPSDEAVTCCIAADNQVFGVYADGHRLAVKDNAGGYLNPQSSTPTPLRVIFPSTVQVLGIHAMDAECGCLCGQMNIICGTESGTGRWNFAAPGYGGKIGELEMDGRFSVFTHKTGYVTSGPFPNFAKAPDEGLFSKSTFNATANGFEKPRPNMKEGTLFELGLKQSKVCPADPGDGSVGSVCGGTDDNVFDTTSTATRLATRIRVMWWLRFDSQGLK